MVEGGGREKTEEGRQRREVGKGGEGVGMGFTNNMEEMKFMYAFD